MSKRDIIIFLFKWKYSLIGYFLFVVAMVTVFVYLLPPKYSAKAVLLVESNRAPVMHADVAYGADSTSVLNSEVAIILSKSVLSSAVDKVGPGGESVEDDSAIGQYIDAVYAWFIDVGLMEPKTLREGMIKKLEDNLDVAPLPASNIITISLGDKNPTWLTKILNAVTDSYIEQHLKIYSSPGSSEVFLRQSERLETELKRRRKELEDYKLENNVSALKDSMSALVRTQSTLTTELGEMHQKLAELTTRYAPGHLKVLLVQERINDINDSLNEAKNKLQKLEYHSAKIQEMELVIASAEKSFLDYQKRYEEARMNDLANTDVVNVRVVEYAPVPTRPNHSRIFYIALSIVGGMILSIAIAFIREYFDHGVSDPDSVEQLLGVPVLGSIEKA